MMKIKSTTVLAVKHNGSIAIGADGQATMGNTVAKSNVKKIRKLQDGNIVTGFAGSTADAFTLLERFDEKLSAYGGNMKESGYRISERLAYGSLSKKVRVYANCGRQRRYFNP